MKGRVIITGASSGIGAAFAERLAGPEAELVLVARRRERLEELARALSERGGAVRVVAQDLSAAGAAEALREALGEAPIDLLINNAGFGLAGAAAALDRERQLAIVDLNARALTDLCLVFGADMLARGAGQVLNVASVVGFFPVPSMAVYAASKAYVLSLSEALDYEWRARGVRVRCLCPGATASEFYLVARGADKEERPASVLMSAEEVARRGLAMLEGGGMTRVTGLANALVAAAPRLLPRTWMRALSARFTPARHEDA